MVADDFVFFIAFDSFSAWIPSRNMALGIQQKDGVIGSAVD